MVKSADFVSNLKIVRLSVWKGNSREKKISGMKVLMQEKYTQQFGKDRDKQFFEIIINLTDKTNFEIN